MIDMFKDTTVRLWNFMIDNPMKLSEMADKIGVSPITLQAIIHEKSKPRHEVRCKIEKFLKEQDGK